MYNRDQYTCSFSKMITYWRQTWNERTNGTTDIDLPFGFVQVILLLSHVCQQSVLFVQLSTFGNDTNFVGGFPWIRWHQTFDIGYVPNKVVPKIFMAVALDLRDDPNK
jgi:sialate O-acetylesterase